MPCDEETRLKYQAWVEPLTHLSMMVYEQTMEAKGGDRTLESYRYA